MDTAWFNNKKISKIVIIKWFLIYYKSSLQNLRWGVRALVQYDKKLIMYKHSSKFISDKIINLILIYQTIFTKKLDNLLGFS